jgi:hypothetical protein
MGAEDPPTRRRRRDKAAHPRGPARIGGDRHQCPLCREHDHSLVTDSVAGGSEIGHRLPRLKPVLGRGLWARPS